MEYIIEIPSDHPALAGHFPGNPIIPGALILDMAARELKKKMGENINIIKITRAKFLSPLKPGLSAEIVFSISGNLARFTCSSSGINIAVGQIEFTKKL